MGIKESRVLNGVHPWLAERVRFLGEVMEAYRGFQIYLSGFRTREEQQVLFRRSGGRPVAPPGCSQHQYGFAVDVAWGVFREESPIGHLSPKELAGGMSALGRQLGLLTVDRDPGHFQVFPGSEFRSWAVASGFCTPTPTPLSNRAMFVNCLSRVNAPFNSIREDLQKAACFQSFMKLQLADLRATGVVIRGSFP